VLESLSPCHGLLVQSLVLLLEGLNVLVVVVTGRSDRGQLGVSAAIARFHFQPCKELFGFPGNRGNLDGSQTPTARRSGNSSWWGQLHQKSSST
jgi:hypothetical protein